jgi:hypothetical protein
LHYGVHAGAKPGVHAVMQLQVVDGAEPNG